MIYKATDRWNGEHLNHRSHKYFVKVGTGPNARYFYSQAEYAAYRNGDKRAGHTSGGNISFPNIKNPLAGLGRKAAVAQIRRQGDKAMSDLRKQQAERIRANNKRDAELNRLRSRFGRKGAQQGSAENRARAQQLQKAAQGRSGRDEALRKAAANSASDSARRQHAYYAKQRVKAAASKKAAQAKRDKVYEAKSNKPIIQRTIDLGNGRTINQTVLGTRDVKRAGIRARAAASNVYNRAKRAASKAYKSAKKTYNSKQSKAYRANAKKKARTTAKRAYNSGRSFVKNLFKKRK